MNNFIVYDLETGGFKKEVQGLCEIAIVAVSHDTLEIVDKYEAVIAPYILPSGERCTYEPGALAVNGLTMAKIEAGKDPSVAAVEIRDFIIKHKIKSKKPLLVGHNIHKFDNPYLEFFLKIFKIELGKLTDLEDSIDTMKWARYKWIKPLQIADHKLSTCCEKAGVELEDAHSAMPDTIANTHLLISFLKSLRGEGGVAEKQERTRDKFQFKI